MTMKHKYFDIHSHLNFSDFNEDREEVIKKMRDEDAGAISVGIDLETSKEVVDLADKYDNIFATIGLHPTKTSSGGFGPSSGGFGPSSGGFGPSSGGFGPSSGGFGPSSGGFGPSSGGFGPSSGGFGPSSGGFGPSSGGFGPSSGGFGPSSGGFGPDTRESFNKKNYKELVKNKKVVAIGECGLDYYRIKNNKSEIKNTQKENLERQIQFALENDLPLMLHFRPSVKTMDAYMDGLDILNSYAKNHGEKLRGNTHFFAGDLDTAGKFLNIGFTLSFTGVITFADNYDEIIKYTPLDMLMSETDCPFAAPSPFRGKRCEPLYIKEIVKRISEIKSIEYEKVEKTLVDNAFKIFFKNRI